MFEELKNSLFEQTEKVYKNFRAGLITADEAGGLLLDVVLAYEKVKHAAHEFICGFTFDE